MERITDKDGVWEVTEGDGCMNKCLIEPSAEYLAENPVAVVIDVKEQAIGDIEKATTISALRTAMLKYVNAE